MLDERVVFGVEAFNAGQYFKAHEIWEGVWREIRSPEKEYYQALIQAAVALHHWNNGNALGAHRLAARALKRFEEFAPVYLGLDTRQLRQVLCRILETNVSQLCDKPTINGQSSKECDMKAHCLITYSVTNGDEGEQ